MIKRTLGKTGYKISVMGLGGYQFTGAFGVPPTEADNIIDYSLAHGINIIDTAPSYGYGEGEAIVGRALLRHQNKIKPYICNKVGHLHELISRKMGDAAFVDPDEIMRNIKHSLWVMRQDHFDILLVHEIERQWKVDFNTGDSVVMSVLEDLKKQGIVEYIGASSWDTTALAKMIRTGRMDVVLSAGGISLLSRKICDELLPAAKDYNVGVMVCACLGQNASYLVSKNREAIRSLVESDDLVKIILSKKLDLLYNLSDKLGMTMIQLVLRYILSYKEIQCNIIGAREVAHTAENIRTFEMGPLDLSYVEEINKIQDMGESMDIHEIAIEELRKKL